MLALQIGGLLTLLVCLILIVKAQLARRRPVRRTELWMMLDPDHRPHADIAQQVVGTVLRRCYLRFALLAAHLSAGLLALSFILRLLGQET